MYRTFVLLFIIILSKSEGVKNSTKCDGFQANFNLKKVIGPWFVVAIIPKTPFPDKDIICYNVEFSETDEAGLRWLMNKTVNTSAQQNGNDTQGVVIRQRYYSDHTLDVWSKSVEGINGCFHQMLSLDIVKNKFNEALTKTAMMQLHFLEDNSETFLIQMLWGKMISAVIYKKEKKTSQDQLKPAFELITKLRGPQRLPRICKDRIKPKDLPLV